MLHVDSLHHLLAVGHRRLLEGLASAKLLDDTGFLIFTFEFLQRAFDVITIFYGYNNHSGFVIKFLVVIKISDCLPARFVTSAPPVHGVATCCGAASAYPCSKCGRYVFSSVF